MPVGYSAEHEYIFEKTKDGDIVEMAKACSVTQAKRIANALVSYIAAADNDTVAAKHIITRKGQVFVLDPNCSQFWIAIARTFEAARLIQRALAVYHPRMRHRKEKKT